MMGGVGACAALVEVVLRLRNSARWTQMDIALVPP